MSAQTSYVERVRAERAAAGRPPHIENATLYRILAAVLTEHAERTTAKTN